MAGVTSRSLLDRRILGTLRARLPMDLGLLGRLRPKRGNVFGVSARDAGDGSEHSGPFARLYLDSRMLDLGGGTLCLAVWLLDRGPCGLGLGTRSLQLD